MSSSEQSQHLLETIDAVLAECSKDPRRRRPTRPPARPSWGGPFAWYDQAPVEAGATPEPSRRAS